MHEGNWGLMMLFAGGHKASKCFSLDWNPDTLTFRVIDLKTNLTNLLTFVLLWYFFNYQVAFTLWWTPFTNTVILPLQQVNKFGLIMPAFSMKKKSFKEVFIITSNRAESQTIGLTTHALCLYSLSWLTEPFKSSSDVPMTLNPYSSLLLSALFHSKSRIPI